MNNDDVLWCRELMGKVNPMDFMYEPPPSFAKGQQTVVNDYCVIYVL